MSTKQEAHSNAERISLKQWIKDANHPVSKILSNGYFALRYFDMPVVPGFHSALYRLHISAASSIQWIITNTYWKPLFKSRLTNRVNGLLLSGSGMPLISGPLQISCGNRCRISTQTTFSGRWCSSPAPELIIGHNVGISWQTTIACGSRIVLGDNVRIGGCVFLAGYPGHPLNAKDRAEGKPDTPDQVGDIILENDVWLGTGVRVMAGVHIGAGTVVAAGSIVTKDIPAGVLAGGVPARVIRKLEDKS